MKNNYTIDSLTIREIRQLYPLSGFEISNDADFLYMHLPPGTASAKGSRPLVRFDGIIFCFITAGSLSITVNLEKYTLKKDQLMFITPNSVLDTNLINDADADVHILLVSTQLIHELNFDINVLSTLPVSPRHHSPLMQMNSEQISLIQSYMALLGQSSRINASAEQENIVRSITRNLIVAVFYQLILLSAKDTRATTPEPTTIHERPRSRRTVYTQDFIRLVRKHFRQEHSVGFYAGKLCISPKYLSLVIKEATGHSAADIIDEFVILEAKNLLRFSGKNIQQVAYELNFSNQSAFGKYFKHLTGMSPSEFQNS